MKATILAVGKPRLGYAQEGIREYTRRWPGGGAGGAPEVAFVKASSDPDRTSRLLLQKSEKMYRVVLDESGRLLSSMEFARKVKKWEEDPGVRRVAFLIGGADGHSEDLLAQADFRWSLGKGTLQHELALVVVLEQLYRAWSINTGHPYHREG